MPLSVDALLFDLDGTLIDSRRDLAESIQFLQRHWGVPVSSEEEVARYVGDGMQRLVERAVPGLTKEKLALAIRIFIRHYQRHCLDHTRSYPGVGEMLTRFQHKPLGIVTNKPWRVTRRIVEGLGWGGLFRSVVGGNTLRDKKPAPGPILYALRDLRVVHPQRAVMVGDGENDVLAGRAAGVRTCGVISNIGAPQKLLATHPDFIVLTAYELMHLFN